MSEETRGRRMTIYTAKEAARYMRVSMFTLSKMESDGGLVPYRTPGGHRRYSVRMLNRYLNDSRRKEKSNNGNQGDEVYPSVSTL